MSDLLSELITPEVEAAVIVIGILIAVLYVISVVWVIRDSFMRGSSPVVWGIIALIPFIGAFAYAMLRPPLLLADRDEQELDFVLKQRKLMSYGECGRCGYPVENEFIVCPRCGVQLKNVCARCHHPLNPDWAVCPYCGTQARPE
jgi:RNA polymerase subunit RPABC4/transcription elongation factor Spt4